MCCRRDRAADVVQAADRADYAGELCRDVWVGGVGVGIATGIRHDLRPEDSFGLLRAAAESDASLIDVLRDDLELLGAHPVSHFALNSAASVPHSPLNS